MIKFLESLGKLLLIALISISPAVYAQDEIIDATHMFEEEVRAATQGLKREARSDFLYRTTGTEVTNKVYKVGDKETFWTKNIVENQFEQTTAVLKVIGKHCYIFLEDGKTLPAETIERVRKNFDEVIYPTNTSNFGFEWKPGIDGDNRITLLMFDIKDGYNGSGGFVGGYFYAADSYLQEKLPAHIKSNEREMFYLDINPADPASDRFLSTIAHEFQHMIHFNQDPGEYTWVNEACSQIAPYLCGFGHASQVLSFMRAPDNSMTAWAKDQMLSNYGQVYLWNYYIYSHILKQAPEVRTSFFKNLVSSKKQGVAGYVEALQTVSKSFTSTFDNFCIANYVNDKRVAKGQYGYDKSLARLKPVMAETVSVLPAKIEGGVFLWSADAVKVDLANAKSEIEISFKAFRGKFGEDLTNSYSVAVVLSDERRSNSPVIKFLNVDYISNSLQGGKLKITPSAEHDYAMIIVIAQAPEEIDDRIYVKAQPMKYTIEIKDTGAVVARAGAEIDISEKTTEYAAFASAMEAGQMGTESAVKQLEAIQSSIVKTAINQIENNNLDSFETLASLISNGSVNAEHIRPVLNKVISAAEFVNFEKKSNELSEKIDSLKQF